MRQRVARVGVWAVFAAMIGTAGAACTAEATTPLPPGPSPRQVVLPPTSTPPQAPARVEFIDAAEPEDAPAPGNILIVLIDDLGTDKLATYDVHLEVPATPTLDALAAEGVTFTKAYANPVCSPSRAVLQTGRRAHRLGIGGALHVWGNWLEEDEVTLPELLDIGTDGAYASSFMGKWHLSSRRTDFTGHPNDQGWEHFSGTMVGIGTNVTLDGLGQTYSNWEKVTNGVVTRTTTYMTTDTADDAIERIEAMPEPWVAVVSFFAPHAPYHVPPTALTPSGERTGTTLDAALYNRMVEAVDTELARVVDAVDAHAELDTTVIVMGDNGTPADRQEPEVPHGKGSMYEGGTRIPLIVVGPDVAEPGSQSAAVVEMSDVFATVADLAGVDVQAQGLDIDGISFMESLRDPAASGVRSVAFSERFKRSEAPFENVSLGLRDAHYRLIRHETHDELYALGDDFVEQTDLLTEPDLDPDAADAYDALIAEIPQFWTDLGY